MIPRASHRIPAGGLHPVLLTILLFASFSMSGCGPSRIQAYPVRGKITYRNQPLAEAMLILHPTTPFPQPTPQPIAFANAQGEFAFTTFDTGDGAPPGHYTITVELREQRQIGEELTRDGRNLLPVRYQSPQTSDLRYEVKPGVNELPAIVLSDR
jgi:hypothetical protein